MSFLSTPKVLLSLNEPITAYSFNGDRSQVALSTNSHEVYIYKCNEPDFALLHVLAEHDQLVTGIDWASRSNRIVTCSQDRNAYVWTYDGSVWTPTLVLLRLHRAATYVRWSPNETKFAVASAAKTVSICSFDAEPNWWVSKHLKKPLATTLFHLAWHPNSLVLAVGGVDRCTRVFSTFLKGIDEKVACIWGDKLPFGTVCADLATASGGWVHGVAFAPSGNALAFVTHDSSFNVYYPEQKELISIRVPTLPLLQLIWINENTVIAAGHETSPLLFSGGPQGWKMLGFLDQGNAQKSQTSMSAKAMFKAMDTKAATNTEPQLNTVHQCSLRSIQPYSDTHFTTAGTDGRLVLWSLLDESLKKLQI